MAGELRGYVWYYCCLALPGREEVLRRDLGRFLRNGAFFRAREPENDTSETAGYSTRADSIWVRPYRLNKELLDDDPEGEPGRFLYPGEGIAADLAPFTDTKEFVAWKENDRSRALTDVEMETMERIVGERASRQLPYRGVVLFGSAAERKVTWIGIRKNPDYAKLTPAQISKRLRYSPGFILPAVDVTGSPELPGTKEGIARLTPESFTRVSRDVGETYRSSRDRVAVIQHRGKEALEEVIRSELTSIAQQPPSERSKEVVIVSDLAYSEVEDAVFEAASALRGVRNVNARLFGREQLTAFIAKHPWLWSEYFGQQLGFRIIANGRTARALLVDGDDAATFAADRDARYALVEAVVKELRTTAKNLLPRVSEPKPVIDGFVAAYRDLLIKLTGDRTIADEFAFGADSMEAHLKEFSANSSFDDADYWMRKWMSDFKDDLWRFAALPPLLPRVPIESSIRHPAAKYIDLAFGGIHLLRGGPGSGKSATVLSLIHAEENPLIIVSPAVGATLTSDDSRLLDELLVSLCTAGHPRVTVIIDRLEREIGFMPAQTLLHQILVRRDALRRSHKQFDLIVIATHWPPDTRFMDTYGVTFRQWSFDTIDLDRSATEEYLMSVGRYFAAVTHINLDALEDDVLEDHAAATPRQMCEAITQLLTRPGSGWLEWHPTDMSFWSEAFKALVTSGEHTDAVAVLRVLAGLSTLWATPNMQMLKLLYCNQLGNSHHHLEEAVRFLDARGWLQYQASKDELRGTNYHLALIDEGATIRQEIVDAALNLPGIPNEEVRRILEAALRYDDVLDDGRRLIVCRRLADLLPSRAKDWACAAVRCGASAANDDVMGPLIQRFDLTTAAFREEYVNSGRLVDLLRMMAHRWDWSQSEEDGAIAAYLAAGQGASERIPCLLRHVREHDVAREDIERFVRSIDVVRGRLREPYDIELALEAREELMQLLKADKGHGSTT